MKLKDLINYLESEVPLHLQESYDNCGLLVGSPDHQVSRALVTLDCTEEVVEEAIQNGCNLILAHHPILFSGIKKLNGKNYVERTVLKAIRADVAIYAMHTNLDNLQSGVNNKIADRLELNTRKILSPMQGQLLKLVTFVPSSHAESVKSALFDAGAGNIGRYSECSFSVEGSGTFKAGQEANPYLGKIGVAHTETELRLEVILPEWRQKQVMDALFRAHPYEEVAYDTYRLLNGNQETGAGMVGTLPKPMKPAEFLDWVKVKMQAEVIRYTDFSDEISKIAVCGGAGSFLLKQAIVAGAQAFVTADFKYHEFFDAEGRIMIADIGHYESEKYTKSLISELILKKFPTFAILLSDINTNPVKYYR